MALALKTRQEPEHLLSEEQVIEILGLQCRKSPRSSLRWLVRTGRLKAVRLGRGVLSFRPADVQACIDACRGNR